MCVSPAFGLLVILLSTHCGPSVEVEIVEPPVGTQIAGLKPIGIRVSSNSDKLRIGDELATPNEQGDFFTTQPVTRGLNVVTTRHPCCEDTLALRSWHQGNILPLSSTTWIEDSFVVHLTEDDVDTIFQKQLQELLESGKIEFNSDGLTRCAKVGQANGKIRLERGILKVFLELGSVEVWLDCSESAVPLNPLSLELTYEVTKFGLNDPSEVCSPPLFPQFCKPIGDFTDQIIQEVFGGLRASLASYTRATEPFPLEIETRPSSFVATTESLGVSFETRITGPSTDVQSGYLFDKGQSTPVGGTSTICPAPALLNAFLSEFWIGEVFDQIHYSRDDLLRLEFDTLPGLSVVDDLTISVNLPPLLASRPDGLWFDIGGIDVKTSARKRDIHVTSAVRVPIRYRIVGDVTVAFELDSKRTIDIIDVAAEAPADLDSSRIVVEAAALALVKDYLTTVPIAPVLDGSNNIAAQYPKFRFVELATAPHCIGLSSRPR